VVYKKFCKTNLAPLGFAAADNDSENVYYLLALYHIMIGSRPLKT
jgi:hypothetical protein